MKVFVFKEYVKTVDHSDNYGDDYYSEDIVFRTLEKSYDLDAEGLVALEKAINLFNNKGNSYKLVSRVKLEGSDISSILIDYDNYLKEEEEKRKKALEKQKDLERKRELAKAEKALKKIADNLGLSLEEVKGRFGK